MIVFTDNFLFIMNIPASISAVFAIFAIFLLFNGSAQMRPDEVTKTVNGVKIEVYNKAGEGANMRKFVGYTSIAISVLAGFAALGLTTTRQAGIMEEAPSPHAEEIYYEDHDHDEDDH